MLGTQISLRHIGMLKRFESPCLIIYGLRGYPANAYIDIFSHRLLMTTFNITKYFFHVFHPQKKKESFLRFRLFLIHFDSRSQKERELVVLSSLKVRGHVSGELEIYHSGVFGHILKHIREESKVISCLSRLLHGYFRL